MLYEGFEGRGFATEAAAALRDWTGWALRRSDLVSYIDPRNAASIRVAERLGATPDGQAPRQDPGDLVFRHPFTT
jgi:RimJ/RimL family protein N-acetyltransferase